VIRIYYLGLEFWVLISEGGFYLYYLFIALHLCS